MRALCIGSAMVDIIVLVASRDVERMTMANATVSYLLLEQGRKIEAESISTHVGGGAVNAAVAMARLGFEAGVRIKLGADGNGALIRERLAAEAVDERWIVTDETEATGTAVMVSAHDRNATIFTQRGANTCFTPAEFPDAVFRDQDLVYVTNLSNRSADCFGDIVRRGRAAGAFVAVNPGIRQLTSRAGALFETLPEVDLLAINRAEAEALVPALAARLGSIDGVASAREVSAGDDRPRLVQIGLSFGGFDMELFDYLRAMCGTVGAKRMLVTDGLHGAFLADGDGVHYCPSLTHVPVRGTAGAGDAFTATAAAALAEGQAPADALRRAALNAAAVVSVVDTQSGLMDREGLAAAEAESHVALPVRFWGWDQLAG